MRTVPHPTTLGPRQIVDVRRDAERLRLYALDVTQYLDEGAAHRISNDEEAAQTLDILISDASRVRDVLNRAQKRKKA